MWRGWPDADTTRTTVGGRDLDSVAKSEAPARAGAFDGARAFESAAQAVRRIAWTENLRATGSLGSDE
jgi:hypothetical protein